MDFYNMWYWIFLFYCITIFSVNSCINFSSYLKDLDKLLECLTIESRKKRTLFYEIANDLLYENDNKYDLICFFKKIFKASWYKGIPIFNKIEYLKRFFYEYRRGLREKIIFLESVKKKIYLSIVGCFCIRVFFIYGLTTSSSSRIDYSIGGVEDIFLNISGSGLIILFAVLISMNFNKRIILSKNNIEKLETLIKYYMEGTNDLEKNLNLSFKAIDPNLLYKKDILELETNDFSKSLVSILSCLKIKEIKEGLSYTQEIDSYLEDKIHDFLSKENSNFLNFLEIFPILELLFLGSSIFFFLAIPIFSII